ncbi:MAG: hypothetical protein K6E20_06510, partial [Acholeplasmatales bacterium]|nr:hypothetical protein [Acholeplasmatales bacterium]
LLYVNDIEYQEDTKNLLNNLINISNNVYEISKSTFDIIKTKDNHVGIVAKILFNEYTLEDFSKMNFICVLDSLEIPGNIGTIYRTLSSINCCGCILVDEISKKNNISMTSSARGSNLIIPTISLSYDEAQKFLLENNYDIYLGEPKLGKNYQEYNYDNKIALVFGNERFGVNSKWYDNKSIKVFIPMEGPHNSLNVGVAASIILYEAYMKRNYKK